MNIAIEITKNTNIINDFNKKKISDNLDNYLLKSLEHKPLKESITLSITGTDNQEIASLIHNFYEERYHYAKKVDDFDNYIRLILFTGGIIAILISEQFSKLISEIFLITGWVLIWETTYDFLFNNIKRKRNAKIYKALATSKIIFKNK